VLSLSLAAGTWFVEATANCNSVLSSPNATLELTDGTTVVASAEVSFNLLNAPISVTLHGIVTPTTTTTWKLRAAATTTNVRIKAAAIFNGVGNNATRMTALQIA